MLWYPTLCIILPNAMHFTLRTKPLCTINYILPLTCTLPGIHSTPAYEKKYGTGAEREARREAQALARAKAMAEQEQLERDEQKQLREVIKASLQQVRRALSLVLVCLGGGQNMANCGHVRSECTPWKYSVT